MKEAAIGIVGLGVMGQSLALNMERNGFPVAGFDLDREKAETFLKAKAEGKDIFLVDSLAELMAVLVRPRRILLMVPAGRAVDSAIYDIKGHMEPGDILIDGGNSFFLDTERRSDMLEQEGLNFVGMGISGGEDGALWGPSMMPGGHADAWQSLKPVLEAIAAKAPIDQAPCVTHIGPRGAGHYVKMVHNGIEYADMQLIAEIYDLLHRGLGISNQELHEIFHDWNQGVLQSYLVEITADIFRKKDDLTDADLLDVIMDEAKQKGTGKWTSQNALDIGAPIPTINAALESRIISGLKTERVSASKILSGPEEGFDGDKEELIAAAHDALYASKITAYAQGLGLLRIASQEYEYNLNIGEIARIWRAGCIIRADLLNGIMVAYDRNPLLTNLLLDEKFGQTVQGRQESWRMVLKTGIDLGVPMLATASALAYYDAYRSDRLPANLTQAQRDYFGAHTYRRLDRPGNFHTEWLA